MVNLVMPRYYLIGIVFLSISILLVPLFLVEQQRGAKEPNSVFQSLLATLQASKMKIFDGSKTKSMKVQESIQHVADLAKKVLGSLEDTKASLDSQLASVKSKYSESESRAVEKMDEQAENAMEKIKDTNEILQAWGDSTKEKLFAKMRTIEKEASEKVLSLGEGARQKIWDAGETAKGGFESLKEGAKEKIWDAGETAKGGFESLKEGAKEKIWDAGETAKGGFESLKEGAKEKIWDAGEIAKGGFESLKEGAKEKIWDAGETAKGGFDSFYDFNSKEGCELEKSKPTLNFNDDFSSQHLWKLLKSSYLPIIESVSMDQQFRQMQPRETSMESKVMERFPSNLPYERITKIHKPFTSQPNTDPNGNPKVRSVSPDFVSAQFQQPQGVLEFHKKIEEIHGRFRFIPALQELQMFQGQRHWTL